MKFAFTNRRLNGLQAAEKRFYAWDTTCNGFGLMVHPTGRKTFFVRKPRFRGRNQPLDVTIGVYGAPLTLDVARKRAAKLRLLMDDGIDPKELQRSAGLTIADYAETFRIETSHRKKPSSIELEDSLFRRHIIPHLGKTELKTLTPGVIRKFLSDVAYPKEIIVEKTKARGKAVVSGGEGTANRAFDVLSAMLNHAVRNEIIDRNPAKAVDKFPQKKRERFLTADEISRLGRALQEGHKDGLNRYALWAIELLLLTGARNGEVLSLEWSFLNREARQLRLPDSKTGAKTLYLSDAALDCISEIEAISGSRWLFPASQGDGHLTGLQKIWQQIRTDAALTDVRLHDLRHTFASVGVAQGHSLYVVGRALGHAKATTTERYAHLSDDPVAQATQLISFEIARTSKRYSQS